MFIVTLLILTVLLSYTLANAAGDASLVALPTFDRAGGAQSYREYARDLILSNRFWIYLALGVGVTLLVSTTLAIAVIMHVRPAAIVCCIVATAFFVARGLMAKQRSVRGARRAMRLFQIAGTCSAAFALLLLLRP